MKTRWYEFIHIVFMISLSNSFRVGLLSNVHCPSKLRYFRPMMADKSHFTTSELLSLSSIRSTLIRQEETIIFALIERAQYRRNYDIYNPKKVKLRDPYGAPLSFLEWMLIETEKLHAKVRRYTSPEEHPFYESLLPAPILTELKFPKLLSVQKRDVDVNNEVMRWYVEKIIDRLCADGDDEQHGSSVICDINALQALSRRIHLGKFVAESKFQKEPELYSKLVLEGDVQGIIEKLTNKTVEVAVLRRSFIKASTYGQDISTKESIYPSDPAGASPHTTSSNANINVANNSNTSNAKIDPKLIADIYRDMIIPLTKDVEVRYLFRRQGVPPPPPDQYYHLCRGPIDAFEGFNYKI